MAVCASISMTASLSSESGAQRPGSPGGKVNETGSPQRGNLNKLGRSIELPGSQGKKEYVMKQTDLTSREIFFPPLALNSHKGRSSFQSPLLPSVVDTKANGTIPLALEVHGQH